MEEVVIKGARKSPQQGNKHRLNEEITGHEVRLSDSEGKPLGVVSLEEAKNLAFDQNLDLVEISPNAEPPVCRIMNYGKFLYEKSKSAKEQRKKQVQVQLKEIKFRPGTDEGDYQVKLRNLTRFLTEGNKAKVTLRYRGREMAHQSLGLVLLNRIKADLAEISNVESFPKMEGRQMVMILGPKRAS
ncbi:translation initiation factor IF-3 [Psychromonas sp. CD1]|uniref:translation initiation factor IF-3 n=1 Tax=Psychromonas sp. CD1 TaxID=1979839 RepID=UPI000B9A25EE|nr:translation initiation factor IF-3 [Psychromonas sp. CD1]